MLSFNRQELINEFYILRKVRTSIMLARDEKLFPEKETVKRPSNATETTPLSSSNELCSKLSQMSARTVRRVSETTYDRIWPIPDSFLPIGMYIYFKAF